MKKDVKKYKNKNYFKYILDSASQQNAAPNDAKLADAGTSFFCFLLNFVLNRTPKMHD